MTLTEQQKQVLEKVKAFLSIDCPVFILKGYAGTGKTTIIKNICSMIESRKEFWLTAPTGRAARVLQSKVGIAASTIHKLIYSDCRITFQVKQGVCEDWFQFPFLSVSIHIYSCPYL